MQNDDQLSDGGTIKATLRYCSDGVLFTTALIACLALGGVVLQRALAGGSNLEPRIAVLLGFLAVVSLGCLYWLLGMWRVRPALDRAERRHRI